MKIQWGDRLLGLLVGSIAGAVIYLVITGAALLTVTELVSFAVWAGLAKGSFLGFCIWGWYHGAYRLGRIVGWLRRARKPATKQMPATVFIARKAAGARRQRMAT